MKRKLVSMLLSVAMVAALMAGCGNSEQATNQGGGDTQQEDGADADADDADADTDADADDVDEEDDEEMAEIVVGWMAFSPLDDSKTDAVEEAINEITEAEINTHVDIQWYDPNTYATQIPMMIQGQEKLDLIMYTPVPGAGFDSFNNQGQLMDVSALLDEYAPEIKSMMGQLLDGTSVKGGVYGVPAYRDMGSAEYITMRKDILDQLNLTEKAQNMSSWTEFEEILAEVAANTDLSGIGNADAAGTVINTQPFFMGADSFADNYGYDNLGDSYQMIYVDDATGKVDCYYFSEEYQQMMQRVRDWYNKGLVYKDSANNQEIGDTMIKNNVFFSDAQMCELGAEITKQAATGYDVVCVKVTDAMLTTGSCLKFGFGVPVTATEPEAAVKFLNLLYTNEDVVNTMAWGVEGRDWVRTDDGYADYPEGVTAETVMYHTADFLNGNQFITIPWAGSGENFRDQQKASLDSAPVSKYMGFSFDQTGFENDITNCYNTAEQYRKGLASGSVDYESTYAQFVEAMKASGIEKIVAAYQEQLDEWVAAQ